MSIQHPLAYFITWTVYGTFLQGDKRWWRRRGGAAQPPAPRLQEWHADRLKHEIVLLSEPHREVVSTEIARLSEFRGWHLWVANPRTNHVHVVVTAKSHDGMRVGIN